MNRLDTITTSVGGLGVAGRVFSGRHPEHRADAASALHLVASNRWNAVFDVTDRCSTAEVLPTGDHVSPDGRVLKQDVQALETYHEHDARVVACLSTEYLPRPAPDPESPEPGHLGSNPPGRAGIGLRPRFPTPPTGGTRLGQRRSGPAGILFHGLAGDVGIAPSSHRHYQSAGNASVNVEPLPGSLRTSIVP